VIRTQPWPGTAGLALEEHRDRYGNNVADTIASSLRRFFPR
jgi:hypothetical protein